MPPVEALVIAGGCALLLLGALLGVPWLRLSRMRSALARPLEGVPADLSISWADELPDPVRGRRAKGKHALEPGQVSALEVLYQLSRFDRRQLPSYSPRQIPQSFDELMSGLSIVPDDPAAAAFAAQSAGEQLLAERLRQLSFDVQLAPPSEAVRSDAPGWLASVDGKEVRLLGVLDVALARSFVEQNPESPIVTLGDYEQEFAEYAQVWALEQVTTSHLLPEPTREEPGEAPSSSLEPEEDSALAALSQLGNLVAGRAVSPVMMSALRGAQLAAKGDKDWVASATSGLTDQAGATVGGWAGARAGTLAGALFGPLGAAAGGFVGGLLGKKVGQGLADGQKQKKLKRLLSKQEEFLAQVPAQFCDALAAQATHLSGVADQLDERGFVASVWPSSACLIRRELAAQYRAWQRKSSGRCLKLRKWLSQKPRTGALAARGRKLLTSGRLAWSDELLELRSELVFIQSQIVDERTRLEGPE